MSQSVFLPNYTIGTDAYEKANGIVKEYGTKVVLIGGKTALSKAENKIKVALTQEIEVVASLWYGGNSTYGNIEQLIQHESVQKADVLFAVGGGRACDTVKVIGEKLAKPVFTFPTIGSNCSPVTAVCVIYNEEGVMDGLFFPSNHLYTPSLIQQLLPKHLINTYGQVLAMLYPKKSNLLFLLVAMI